MQKNKDYQKETQPVSNPCTSSIFKNPLPEHANQLVEETGLKGHQIGGAKVSEMHSNFIINAGSATAKDVLDLIAFIQKTIKKKYDIDMHTEVEIIGEKQ